MTAALGHDPTVVTREDVGGGTMKASEDADASMTKALEEHWVKTMAVVTTIAAVVKLSGGRRCSPF